MIKKQYQKLHLTNAPHITNICYHENPATIHPLCTRIN